MISLLHLHPIFEFFLTVYFGFIIAPEFLGRFLLERVPSYIEKSRGRVIKKLDRIIGVINTEKEQYPADDPDFVKYDGGLLHSTGYLPFLNEALEKANALRSKINKEADEIKSTDETDGTIIETVVEKEEALKKKLAKTARNCYENVFPFAGAFCFIILLFNACHWPSTSHEHDIEFLTYVSHFSFLTFIYLNLLIFGRRLLNISSHCRNYFDEIRYRFFYSVFSMIIILGLTFYVFPRINFHIITFESELKFRISIIISVVFISAYTLLLFGIELLYTHSKRYFESSYNRELKEALSNPEVVINDYSKNIKKQKAKIAKGTSRLKKNRKHKK